MGHDPDTERPRVRPLEVHPVTTGPQRGVVLVDPMGLVPGQVFVPEHLLPVAGLFDGTRTIPEIEAILAAAGAPPPEGFVADLARRFDESLLLEGELFRNTLLATARDFAGREARPARHAGSHGLPADPDECAHHLESLLPSADDVRHPTGPAPRALIAPHIDLGRGVPGYVAAYRALRERDVPDLFVVLGTGHAGPSAPVTGLGLHWETPRGSLRTDREFVGAVHERIGPPDPLDVFLHREEHSIEFQMVWLAHLFGARDIRVAGFLCGDLPSGPAGPDGEDYVQRIVDAFREAAAGKRVCFVAGADLAHVGPFFGDPEPVDGGRLARLAEADHARLRHLEAGRPGAFHAAVLDRDNPDRVCSATALYLTARIAGTPARLLHYGQASAEDGSQCVTFCSAAFDGG